jgi:hypothetical protein
MKWYLIIKSLKSVGKFLFSFLLPQKLNRRMNVVLAYNGWVFAKLPLRILQIIAQVLTGNFANTLL